LRQRKRALFLALATVALGVIVPSAWAWTVTMTAEPALKRTHSWKIEKSASVSSLTLKKGQSATVSYSVTVGPNGAPVDSDWSVNGTMEMTDDANITVNSVVFTVIPEAPVNTPAIPATHACEPMTFPVDLGIQGLKCTYSATLPDSVDRRARMFATATEDNGDSGSRNSLVPFSFDTATVNDIDECVDVTDSMAGALGTVCAADAPKTFTYSTTVGPFNDCGSKTVNNVASFKTNDSGAVGSASDSIAVTVTDCEPPKPKCPLPSLVWKFVGIIGPTHVKNLLPLTLGNPGGSKSVVVTSNLQALVILGAEWYSSNVVAHLQTEQLAAKLNKAAGRDVSSIAGAMAAADTFLASKSTSSSLSYSEKAYAKSLTEQLEKYNNKCIPDFDHHDHGDHDWCKRHWDKPDHDWHKWNWKKFDWDD
jgi:hypothetical protein